MHSKHKLNQLAGSTAKHKLIALVAMFFLQLSCAERDWPAPWQFDAATLAPSASEIGFSDALSAPTHPTIDAKQFLGAAACASCHRQHADEWQQSAHAHAMHDRVFQGLVKLQREQRGDGAFDRYCVQCHSPAALRSGQIGSAFQFDSLAGLALEGVSCEVCHRTQRVERPYGAGLVIAQDELLRGPLADPQAPHPAERSALFESSELCASCHDVRSLSGFKLETPYEEWLASPAAAEGRTCQSCHMLTYDGRTASAYAKSPERRGLHRHHFNALEPLEARACDDPGHVCSAAELEAKLRDTAGGLKLDVTVQSLVDGHGFPTGSVFFREVWLAVEVRCAHGELVYESGSLDDDKDLLSDSEDPQLQVLHGHLVDAAGAPTLLPWLATDLKSNALKPRESRVFSYSTPTPAPACAPRARVRLRFRPFSPRLLRMIDESALVDQLEITDIAEVTVSLRESSR